MPVRPIQCRVHCALFGHAVVNERKPRPTALRMVC
jgi:hypothetical protein